MHGIMRPHQALVRPTLAKGALDIETYTQTFLGEAHASALRRFALQRVRASTPSNLLAGDDRTVQRIVPAGNLNGCGGTIVAHVSARAFAAWASTAPGKPSQGEEHVLSQLQLVLEDLTDHDVHVCLNLTQTQCDVYSLDLAQLIAESLDRTTFSRLHRAADLHWEGTLVKSLDPPALVLVISIDV